MPKTKSTKLLNMVRVRLPPDLNARLFAAQKTTGLTKSQIVRNLIDGKPYDTPASDEEGITLKSIREEIQERTQQIFAFIVAYKGENDGNSPSLREISDHLNGVSTSTICRYMDILVTEGKIEYKKNSARNIIVVGGQWTYQTKEQEHA